MISSALKQTSNCCKCLSIETAVKSAQKFRQLATSTPESEQSAAGLPFAQKCKNLLAGNWRGQVTVVNAAAASQAAPESRITSFLAEYAAPRGLMPPAVLLHRHTSADHIQDLVQKMRSHGMQLPCLSLLGDLILMQPAELGYVLRRSQKVASRQPGWPMDWESRASDPNTLGYALHIERAHYVDMTGKQHEVDMEDMDAAFMDPLAPGLTRLVSSVNSSPRLATALRSFCAAYMDTIVNEAVMTQADRHGFTLMALPSPQFVQDPEVRGLWREFRFDLNQEMGNVNSFMQRIEGMASEAAEMLAKGKYP